MMCLFKMSKKFLLWFLTSERTILPQYTQVLPSLKTQLYYDGIKNKKIKKLRKHLVQNNTLKILTKITMNRIFMDGKVEQGTQRS